MRTPAPRPRRVAFPGTPPDPHHHAPGNNYASCPGLLSHGYSDLGQPSTNRARWVLQAGDSSG
eukprot:12854042-Alexandrium_andersonii.AAC.1